MEKYLPLCTYERLEKLKETSFSEKEDFYSYLDLEGITDAVEAHAKRVCKSFEIKKFMRI